MKDINETWIHIVPEETHGRRIICACGFQDKAIPTGDMITAATHNNKAHLGSYKITRIDCED